MATDPKVITGATEEPAPKPKLYSYWLSSCSHRVRIVLNLKGLEYEYKAVNLLKGEQSDPEYEKLNPVKLVPTWVDADIIVADSFAIISFLEDKYPERRVLPVGDLKKKALNLQVASIVGSGIQPIQIIHARGDLKEKLGYDESLRWLQQHIHKGFTALEELLTGCAGRYATGDEVLLGDVFLAPQIYAGINRFQIDMSPYPTLTRLHDAYTEHPAFQAALPDRQPDAFSS